MFNDQTPSPKALGDRVRAASRHQGPWPRISVWHGTADKIVKPSNAENLIRQWSNVHRLRSEPTKLETIGPHARRIWKDEDGISQIEAVSVVGMGHGVPLAPQTSPDACGVPGPFFLDVGLCSTVQIAEYFGIDGGVHAEGSEWMRALGPVPPAERELETATWASAATDDNGDVPGEPDGNRQTGSFDPNSVIAAAFQAAGLPAPTGTSRGKRVDPTAIIETTLKSVGLWRR